MPDLWTSPFCLIVFVLSLWRCTCGGRNQWLIYKPLLKRKKKKSPDPLDILNCLLWPWKKTSVSGLGNESRKVPHMVTASLSAAPSPTQWQFLSFGLTAVSAPRISQLRTLLRIINWRLSKDCIVLYFMWYQLSQHKSQWTRKILRLPCAVVGGRIWKYYLLLSVLFCNCIYISLLSF